MIRWLKSSIASARSQDGQSAREKRNQSIEGHKTKSEHTSVGVEPVSAVFLAVDVTGEQSILWRRREGVNINEDGEKHIRSYIPMRSLIPNM